MKFRSRERSVHEPHPFVRGVGTIKVTVATPGSPDAMTVGAGEHIVGLPTDMFRGGVGWAAKLVTGVPAVVKTVTSPQLFDALAVGARHLVFLACNGWNKKI